MYDFDCGSGLNEPDIEKRYIYTKYFTRKSINIHKKFRNRVANELKASRKFYYHKYLKNIRAT